MTIVADVFKELFGMFVADAFLSAAIMVVVAVSAALGEIANVDTLVCGLVLLLGCLVVVIESVRRAALRVRRLP